jgi:hypothetical protein
MPFDQARYIKLGSGASKITKTCINRDLAYIGFGTDNDELFKAASSGDWEAFKALSYERDTSGSEQARKRNSTSATNQVKAFFEADDRILWITFFEGRLFHGVLSSHKKPVIDLNLRGCVRHLKSGWSSTDSRDVPLRVENLSGNLTKVRGFKGTSCALGADQLEYLLRRLSGRVPDFIDRINHARMMMEDAVLSAIRTLQPKDFELLVENIFSGSWRRIGQMGGSEKFIDIIYEEPLNPDRRIAVQVKSETSPEEVSRYCQDEQFNAYEKLFFVFHTPAQADILKDYEAPEGLELVDGKKLASLVVDSGLIHWLREKAS